MPVCDCHGVEMYWHKRNDRLSGGTWRCREKRKPRAVRTLAIGRRR